jgi:hypothetical protein
MEKVRKLLAEAEWIFAKTMPENPHHYCLRKNFGNDKDFVYLVQYIRNNGVKEDWKGYSYIYLYLDGYRYWSMGAPINNEDGSLCTILINKAVVERK